VVISHPKLVETGLDFFDKARTYNFPTLCFYETGYILPTLRQAAGRSFRLLQWLPCKVVYFYYAATMQDRAMGLMGRKLIAAQSLEGKFSSEGLAALAGDDSSVEMALARSLVNCMDEGDARRMWSKVAATQAAPPAPRCPPDWHPEILPATAFAGHVNDAHYATRALCRAASVVWAGVWHLLERMRE
jgi:hypothetical protein